MSVTGFLFNRRRGEKQCLLHNEDVRNYRLKEAKGGGGEGAHAYTVSPPAQLVDNNNNNRTHLPEAPWHLQNFLSPCAYRHRAPESGKFIQPGEDRLGGLSGPLHNSDFAVQKSLHVVNMHPSPATITG